jgi:dihydroorotate dehydrogenase electron transfer subunit
MKVIRDLRVVSNRPLNEEHYLLKLRSEDPLPEILPGQFAEVRIDGSDKVFLRRSISIHDIDSSQNTLDFLIKKVGTGTTHLSNIEPGKLLSVIFPLGNGFDLDVRGPVILIGGGCGVAPLMYLSKKLDEKGIKQEILLGARSKEGLMEVDAYASFGKVHITTDDGSAGEKALITHHSIWKSINDFERIYCCGPEVMMKAVAGLAHKNGVDCFVSLENTMACGIGACLCCVTETVRGNECVCTSGPVFNINDLKWQI